MLRKEAKQRILAVVVPAGSAVFRRHVPDCLEDFEVVVVGGMCAVEIVEEVEGVEIAVVCTVQSLDGIATVEMAAAKVDGFHC